jgi:hypothetical protein
MILYLINVLKTVQISNILHFRTMVYMVMVPIKDLNAGAAMMPSLLFHNTE